MRVDSESCIRVARASLAKIAPCVSQAPETINNLVSAILFVCLVPSTSPTIVSLCLRASLTLVFCYLWMWVTAASPHLARFFCGLLGVGITISFFIGIRVEIRLKDICERTKDKEFGVEIEIA